MINDRQMYQISTKKSLACVRLQVCQDRRAAVAGGARRLLAVQILLVHGRLRDRRLRLRHPDADGRPGAQEAARVHLPQLPAQSGRVQVRSTHTALYWVQGIMT